MDTYTATSPRNSILRRTLGFALAGMIIVSAAATALARGGGGRSRIRPAPPAQTAEARTGTSRPRVPAGATPGRPAPKQPTRESTSRRERVRTDRGMPPRAQNPRAARTRTSLNAPQRNRPVRERIRGATSRKPAQEAGSVRAGRNEVGRPAPLRDRPVAASQRGAAGEAGQARKGRSRDARNGPLRARRVSERPIQEPGATKRRAVRDAGSVSPPKRPSEARPPARGGVGPGRRSRKGEGGHKIPLRQRPGVVSLDQALQKSPRVPGNRGGETLPRPGGRRPDEPDLEAGQRPESPFSPEVGANGRPNEVERPGLDPVEPDVSQGALDPNAGSGSVRIPGVGGNVPGSGDFGAGPSLDDLADKTGGAPQRGEDPARTFAGQDADGQGQTEQSNGGRGRGGHDNENTFLGSDGVRYPRLTWHNFKEFVKGAIVGAGSDKGPPGLPVDGLGAPDVVQRVTGDSKDLLGGIVALIKLKVRGYWRDDFDPNDAENPYKPTPNETPTPGHVDPNSPEAKRLREESEKNTHYGAIRDAARRQSRVNPRDDDGSQGGTTGPAPDRSGVNKRYGENHIAPRGLSDTERAERAKKQSAKSSNGDGVINPGEDAVNAPGAPLPGLGGGLDGPGAGGNPAASGE